MMTGVLKKTSVSTSSSTGNLTFVLYVFKSSLIMVISLPILNLIKSFRLIKKNRIEINLKNDNLYIFVN